MTAEQDIGFQDATGGDLSFEEALYGRFVGVGVDDQIGTPTWARGLAQCVWTCIEKEITGVHHWTDAGAASWYDFAVAIQEIGLELNLLDKQIPIYP